MRKNRGLRFLQYLFSPPAVINTPGPVVSDIILHEERRHDAAVDEIADGHSKYDWENKHVYNHEALSRLLKTAAHFY